MNRFESSAWTLAGGGLSVFALAVVLKETPWQGSFALLLIAVFLWALRAPAVTGGVLGLMAWAFHTGFDVEKTGELVFAGMADAVRLFTLIGVGMLGALAGQWLTPDRAEAGGPQAEVPAPEDHPALKGLDSSGVRGPRSHAVPRPRVTSRTARAVPVPDDHYKES